jgi:hypothetical protein
VSILDSLASIPALCREYYGSDENEKPNNHCYWDRWTDVPGWYETDDCFRKRIQASLSRPEVSGT